MKIIYATIFATQLCAGLVFGQAFTNLNFEAADIPPGTSPTTATELSASVAIPGWSASSSDGTDVVYDGVSFGRALVTINDSQTQFLISPLQGNYSVILSAGPDIGAAGASSISQTALVPVDTQSILMDIAFPHGVIASAPFTVTLGGQQVDMSPFQIEPSFTVYGGNVGSSLAGQVEALTITQFPPAFPTVPPSAVELDDIVFSPDAIPEPGTWALMLCGAGLFTFVKRKRER